MRLVYVIDGLIPWQWHHETPWTDEITGMKTSYLAGFITRENAVECGRLNGWMI